MKYKIDTKAEKNGIQALICNGSMTIYTVKDLKKDLMKKMTGYPALNLDLKGVTEIDTAGFQLIIFVRQEADRLGKKVRITDVSREISSLFVQYNEKYA